jgi:magnesium-transporting ATPase (P-type)
MIAGWALVSPIASYIALFLKGIGHLWFQLHTAFQVLTVACMFIAFVIVEATLGSSREAHFKYAHNDIGIIIVILAFGQVMFGYLANKMWSPDRPKTPIFPDKIHWWLGRLLFALAVINIFLGFDAYGFTKTKPATFIIFAVWVVIMVLLVAYMKGATHTSGNHHEVEKSGKDRDKLPKILLVIYAIIAVALFATIAGLMFT